MWQLTFIALLASATATTVYLIKEAVHLHESQLNNGLSYNFKSKIDDISRETCNRHGKPDSYSNYENARVECGTKFYGSLIQEDNKALDDTEEDYDVSKALCRIKPQITGCLANVTRAIAACVEPERRARADILINAGEAVLEYVCHNEGERITSFVNDGGQECVSSKQDEITQCFRPSAQNNNATKDNADNHSEESVKLSEAEECREALELQKCVVGHFKQCSKPAPAIFIDGMFNSLLNATPCQRYRNI